MADLVGDHIGLRELAGLALAATETGLDFAEERGIEVDLLILGTVERAHGALRRAAAGRVRLPLIEHEDRLAIGLPVLPKDVRPHGINVADRNRHEVADVVARFAGPPRLPARRLRRLLNVRAAAGKDLGAADQQARIDPERPADQAQHHDGADPESPAAQRQTEAAAAAKSTALFAAAILDFIALRFIQTHCSASSLGFSLRRGL